MNRQASNKHTWLPRTSSHFLAICLMLAACNEPQPANSNAETVNKTTKNQRVKEQKEQIKEVEPNNKAEEATLLNLEAIGKGFINNAAKQKGDSKKAKKVSADRDYWKFEIKNMAKDVRIEISGLPSMDIAAYLYKERDPRDPIYKAYSNLDSDQEKNAKKGELIPSIVLQPDSYILRIAEFKRSNKTPDHHDADNPYYIKLKPRAVDERNEAEPNDRKVDANPLSIDESKQGYLATKKDEDWYKLELPQLPGQKMLRIELESPADMRPSIILKNSIEAELKKVSAPKDGEKAILPAYFIDDPTQELYIVVYAHWDHNQTEPYTLTATLLDVSGEVEKESNDRPIEATMLNEMSRIRGHIDMGHRLDKAPWRSVDEDWYKLSFSEAKQVSLSLSGLPEVDLKLAVFNADGKNKLVAVDENRKKEGEVFPRIIFQDALVRVSARRNHYNNEHPYELAIKTYPDDKETEYEPNNTPEQATTIKRDKLIRAWMHPAKDVDVYSFQVSEKDAGPHTITISGIAMIRLAASINDQDNNEIASKKNKQDKIPLTLKHDFKPGKYTISIRDARNRNSNPLNSYSIKITK